MAVKKSEIYSSIWNACDELRGSMDATQYKDYILTFLFIRYVTDKYKGDKYADVTITNDSGFDAIILAKNNPEIGEKLNKIIDKIAEDNPKLKGVVNIVDFDDDSKLGSGKDKVERLTKLITIFEDEKLDFKKNKAGGDDILGDAYEFLMKNFATQSGKSKGQFYTPSEVSRVMAKLIEINKSTKASDTLYDPACGSGSLLIRAASEAHNGISIYGQENDLATAGLANMNLILHNYATGTIIKENTLSKPQFKDGLDLKRFDYAVANPPFSYKAWMTGIDFNVYRRFDIAEFGALPPTKNGDYAWLLHFIYSLKPGKGKGAIILPHGVLFRGNAEATIREKLIKKKIIKGIIGLPSNLFFGTGIPACIIIIDKENIAQREGIFIIDASKGFIKDGNKNKLREQDIRKIVDYFNNQITEVGYSRLVKFDEIEKNEFNLNIPRYIDNNLAEDIQDISAHLNGDIPQKDIDNLEKYWQAFPTLKNELIEAGDRKDYFSFKHQDENLMATIFKNKEFIAFGQQLDNKFELWRKSKNDYFVNLNGFIKPKDFIERISQNLLNVFSDLLLIDKYDIYQCLMDYWHEKMQDDIYAIVFDGWKSGQDIEKEFSKKKDGTLTDKMKSFEGRVIPKDLLIKEYFPEELEAINKLEESKDSLLNQMQQIMDENSDEEGLLTEVINDKNEITKANLQKRIKEIKNISDLKEEYDLLKNYEKLMLEENNFSSAIKQARKDLDSSVMQKYSLLTIEEIKKLVIDKKWFYDILESITKIYDDISHVLIERINQLSERYENTLSSIEKEVQEYEDKVKSHLMKMGYKL